MAVPDRFRGVVGLEIEVGFGIPAAVIRVPHRSCCFARTQTCFIAARGLFCMYCLQTLQIGECGHVGHAMAAFMSIVMLSDSTPKRGPMMAPIVTLLFTTLFAARA